MKRILLGQATMIAMLAAGLLFQQGQIAHVAQDTINGLDTKAIRTLYYESDQGCYEDEIGIWMNNQTACIPVDDVLSPSEYNLMIERLYKGELPPKD